MKILSTLLFILAVFLASCSPPTEPDFALFNLSFDYSGVHNGNYLLFHTPPDSTAILYSGQGDSSLSFGAIRWKDGHRHADIFTISIHSPQILTSDMTLSSNDSGTIIHAEFGLNSAMTTVHNSKGTFFVIADSSGFQMKSMKFHFIDYKPIKLDTVTNILTYKTHAEFSGTLVNSKGELITITNGYVIDQSF